MPTTISLGDLVAAHPAAAAILHRHQIDFCCGGRQDFASACDAAGVDPAQVEAEITRAEVLDSEADLVRWTERPLTELIAHIVATYHEPLRRELPELIAMATKVERVYALQEHCPHGLAKHLLRMHQAVLDHLKKEEEILFPAIARGRGADCAGPVACMEAEHEDHGANLRRMRELAHGLAIPQGACTTFRALYQRLEHFERELMKHIHLENSILFPRALQGEGCCGFCQNP